MWFRRQRLGDTRVTLCTKLAQLLNILSNNKKSHARVPERTGRQETRDATVVRESNDPVVAIAQKTCNVTRLDTPLKPPFIVGLSSPRL